MMHGTMSVCLNSWQEAANPSKLSWTNQLIKKLHIFFSILLMSYINQLGMVTNWLYLYLYQFYYIRSRTRVARTVGRKKKKENKKKKRGAGTFLCGRTRDVNCWLAAAASAAIAGIAAPPTPQPPSLMWPHTLAKESLPLCLVPSQLALSADWWKSSIAKESSFDQRGEL